MTMRLLAEVISSFDFFRDKKIKSPVKTRLYRISGWGGWIRTNECRHQKPMPYHLATPQSIFHRPVSNRLISTCRHIFMPIFLLMQELFLFFMNFFYKALILYKNLMVIQ